MGSRYDIGDVLRYSRASKDTGIAQGTYAHVKIIDTATNRLTVELQDGTERTYDPRRQRGVSVFREEMRGFSVGDRIQFTAPANELKIANRELGAIEAIDGAGRRLNLKMDSGRSLEVDPNKHPHLDYGYAMTSHSSQGQTANRVLIHLDTELAAKDLLNNRMAYVSVSRGASTRNYLPMTARSWHGPRTRFFKAERACTGNHPRANDGAAAGNLQTTTAGAQHRSRNRF